MRYFKIIAFSILVLIVSMFFAGSIFGQITISPPGPLTYHVFLAADLGLGTTNKGNKDFRITFNPGPTGQQQIEVLVSDIISGDLLVEGATDPQDYATEIQGTYFIGDLDENFGGDFDVLDTGDARYQTVLATGRLPRGQYRITFRLDPHGASTFIDINVAPPYVEPLSPVDMQTEKAGLDFRWVSNINDQQLRFFRDPAGNREVLAGSRAPFTHIAGSGDPFIKKSYRVDGAAIAPVLQNEDIYYWRIDGYIKTSHGDELREGVITAFQYFDQKSALEYIGLDDADKQKIKDLLIQLLQQIVEDDRAAKSLNPLEVDRITKDNSPVTTDELISILTKILSGEVSATSIQLQ